jgi:hypothetical protein
MAMLLDCRDDAGRPLDSTRGMLAAITSDNVVTDPMSPLFGMDHPLIPLPPVQITPGVWSIDRDPVWAPMTFSVALAFPNFDLVMITYVDGTAPLPVSFHQVLHVPAMVDVATFMLSWSELDGQRLPDGDEIVLTTLPATSGAVIELQSSATVNWWKEIHLADPVRRVEALYVRTDGPSQSRFGPNLAWPVGSPRPPQRDVFAGLALIFHKPKFLGTDTPIYRLEMNDAPWPADNHPQLFQFLWRRQ